MPINNCIGSNCSSSYKISSDKSSEDLELEINNDTKEEELENN